MSNLYVHREALALTTNIRLGYKLPVKMDNALAYQSKFKITPKKDTEPREQAKYL